ncbi:threonine ammonia-lyase [Tuberibacillus calidus]|jgi:threonine dehydratase|uniref:threonine ammonia-lyase n=1 Tax=Tuberibacillus calidus TaxID=340097 RepID=UPI000405AA03|nr:threonine/serine dehydratase [Tuberibacillus calidus]
MERLYSIVHRTPLKRSKTIDRLTGKTVYLKMENAQKTGSFKIRGATNKIFSLTDREASQGVVAASAGNHAQGVALSGTMRGLSAKIYMPVSAPKAKVQATESYGAKVVLIGETYQEAYNAALSANGTFVHAFDDPHVIAGQGTVAFEMLQQCPELDTIIVPVGGGGLLAGTAVAVKETHPEIKLIGVQAEGAQATYKRFYGAPDERLPFVQSIADGLLVKETGRLTFPIIERYVDQMITVSDRDIACAILLMLEREKMLVEGAGASALAALLAKPHLIGGNKIGVMITGGNVDASRIPQFLDLAQSPKSSSLMI